MKISELTNIGLLNIVMENTLVSEVTMPQELKHILKNMDFETNDIGCSKACIYKYTSRNKSFYLKVQEMNYEFKREHDITKWLKGKLPVPDILYWGEENNTGFLLMTEVEGNMACDEKILLEPDKTIKLLAEGLKMVHSIDIKNCPFDATLSYKLPNALGNIQSSSVDVSRWEEDNEFKTPEDLYQYLQTNKPKEDLVFTHGDYCLPNIFFKNDSVSGFIDMGRGGVSDRWQDIALCIRSVRYNLRDERYVDMLLKELNIKEDKDKLRYYILMDELF